MLHGEDVNNWPDTDTRSRVTIDINRIIAFNEIEKGNEHEGKTNIRLDNDNIFLVCTPYDEFKKILQERYQVDIPSNAI